MGGATLGDQDVVAVRAFDASGNPVAVTLTPANSDLIDRAGRMDTPFGGTGKDKGSGGEGDHALSGGAGTGSISGGANVDGPSLAPTRAWMPSTAAPRARTPTPWPSTSRATGLGVSMTLTANQAQT